LIGTIFKSPASGAIYNAIIWKMKEQIIVTTKIGLFLKGHLSAEIYSLRQLKACMLSKNTI
jgi:hypothetical protein